MKGKKLLFSLFAVVVLLAVMATPVMAAETTEITGNVSEVLELNRADGKMQSTTPNTLTNALAVTTGSLSGATVTTTSQECVNTSAPGETSITLSVSQEIVYADAADTGYSITLTYTAAAKP